jgi:hypothetical protein
MPQDTPNSTFVCSGRECPRRGVPIRDRFYETPFRPKSFLTIPGVEVMITIFCDFRQVLEKKWRFFSTTTVMITFLNNLALFRVTNAIFWAKIFIKTSVPENVRLCAGWRSNQCTLMYIKQNGTSHLFYVCEDWVRKVCQRKKGLWQICTLESDERSS